MDTSQTLSNIKSYKYIEEARYNEKANRNLYDKVEKTARRLERLRELQDDISLYSKEFMKPYCGSCKNTTKKFVDINGKNIDCTKIKKLKQCQRR